MAHTLGASCHIEYLSPSLRMSKKTSWSDKYKKVIEIDTIPKRFVLSNDFDIFGHFDAVLVHEKVLSPDRPVHELLVQVIEVFKEEEGSSVITSRIPWSTLAMGIHNGRGYLEPRVAAVLFSLVLTAMDFLEENGIMFVPEPLDIFLSGPTIVIGMNLRCSKSRL